MDEKRNEKGQFKKIYSINEDFFNNINTEEKAYTLGFFYADGCNFAKTEKERCISFTQLEQDVDILNKIKLAMESNHIFIEEIQSTNNKKKYTLRIYNKKLSRQLEILGATPNKSLTLKFPDLKLFSNKSLIKDFIRGYFDGDGCIWDGKPKYMQVKDYNHPGKMRTKLIHNVKFTFTGNYDFINSLQDYLVGTLGFKKTKLNFSKAKDPTNNTKSNVCTMEYSGRKQIKKFYDFIYKDSTIYGNRKKKKFEIINCALDEKSSKDTTLIAETPLES